MQTEIKLKADNILKNGVFIYEWKGKKPFTQYYQIDFNKPVKIGGLSQDGYMLKFFKDGSKTDTCITYLDALRVAQGQIIEQHHAKVFFKKLN